MHKGVESSSNPLRVAVNAVPLLSPLTGIGQYVKALMLKLQGAGHVDANYFYAGSWSAKLRNSPLHASANQLKIAVRRFVPNAYELSRWLQQKRFADGLKNFKADVYHEPNFLAFDFDGPTVVTVHDLSWIRYPQAHPAERVRAMNKYFKPSLERASKIITVSYFVKRELIDWFGVEESKIHPIHLAAEPLFSPSTPQETSDFLQRFGLVHGQYWISVGTLEPRKNLSYVIDAFLKLPAADRKRCPLVVVGMLGWGYQSLLLKLDSLIQSGEVIYTGYLPRMEQAALMSGAKALLYPSLYEGFGLPLVEAMQCGVPVVAANASCLPEVLGGVGVLVDPHDASHLANAMQELLDDPRTCERLGALALVRSREFSWQRCAEQTLAVYRLAAGVERST